MSTVKGKEYELAVRIAGKVDKTFDASLQKVNSKLKLNTKTINDSFNTLDRSYDKIVKVGARALKATCTAALAAGAALAAVGVAVVNVGKEFESAFAGVKKTVDATAEEYEVLRQSIIDMSLEIPSSAADIAKVMEVAGQLGIPIENLTEFTKTMVNLGVSTNLSAEEAATALAKFANITGMDASNYEKLGATIVDLGNKFATTEADIVQMSMNLAATGELTGLTEPQILALSTAMSSVGIAAERGGSSMSKVLKKMLTAVELNSDALNDYASVAGMTSEEFSTLFKEDSIKALSAFIDGLDDTERNGKSAIVILKEMGLDEIRLSNTLLALANASGVMTYAVETANEAWDEGTALAIEASKRYETVDSKLQILKNSFYALGITAYDEIRGPLTDGIDWLTSVVERFTEYVSGPDGISKWIYNIKKEIPTLISNAKTFGGTVLGFIKPLLAAGKWLVKNPKFLATVFIALGTALATYKIASTISHIVSGITTLFSNPIMLGIAAITLAIGGIAAAIYATNERAKELRDENLAAHFGNIALSLEDLEQVANHLVNKDGVLDKLKEAILAIGEANTISEAIENAQRVIDKSHWKISIGMELTSEDAEEYREAITSFITNCQNYITQQHYAVKLSYELFTSDKSMTETVDSFYMNNSSELTRLGKELQEAVNKGFEDGLLEFDEIEKITELQEKMAKIQSMIAGSQFEAKLELLSTKGMGALNSESFKNLQKQIEEIVTGATGDYDEAYITALTNEKTMLDAGSLTAAQYNERVSNLRSGYRDNIAGIQEKALSFQIETIMNQYASEFSSAIPGLTDMINSYFTEDRLWVWKEKPGAMWNELAWDIMDADVLSSDTQDAVALLFESMKPTVTQMQKLAAEYTAAGETIPESITTALKSAAVLATLSGDEDFVWSYLSDEISKSPEYFKFMEDIYDAGGFIPDELANGIKSNRYKALQAIYDTFPKDFDLFNKPLYGIDINKPFQIPQLSGHATGGIFNTPHIANFCENGPESIIPINGSQNALSLWERTGRLLGMESAFNGLEISGGNGATIEYKPTLVFNGAAPSQGDLESAMHTSQEEFEELMNRYIKNHGRVAF